MLYAFHPRSLLYHYHRTAFLPLQYIVREPRHAHVRTSLPAELRPRGVPDPVRVRERARVLEQQPVALLRVDRDVREERRERLPAPARAREEQRREARAGLRGQRRRGEVREQRARRVGERVLRGEVVALRAHVQRLGEERVAEV